MRFETTTQLRKELRGSEFFTLSFGAIIGVGWIIVLGDWLKQAGPLGAILAFIAGGAVTLLVGFCYAELGALFPASGGEVASTYEIFGVRTCFATGWFLTLSYIATTVFEAVSVGWVAGALFPSLQGPILYRVAGGDVRTGGLVLGLGGTLIITLLNYRGIKPTAKVQSVLTYAKILLVIVIVIVGVTWGRVENLKPLFQRSASGTVWPGMFSIFLTTPFWMAGFNTVAQLLEERSGRTSLRRIGWMIVLSIGAATAFYCLIILACSMTMPWQNLLKLDLPAATSFEVAFHSRMLSRSVLTIALLGNITVWNSEFLSATRVLFALGRARIISPRFAALVPSTGAPGIAVVFIGVLVCAGTALGRAAIEPMVNLASCCFAIPYVLVCLGVLGVRRRKKLISPYRAPGGRATAIGGVIVSLATVFLALYEPYVNAGRRVPVEWWLFTIWAGLGVAMWVAATRLRQAISEPARRLAILHAYDLASSTLPTE